MHKNDPMRRYYRFFYIMEVILLIIIWLPTVASIAVGRPNYFTIGECILFTFFLTFIFFGFRRRHQRTEKRRVLAHSGDPKFLAQPQPVANAYALPLPTRVFLNMDIKSSLKFLIIFYFILAIVGSLAFLIIFPPSQDQNITFFAIFTLLSILAIILIFSFILSLLTTKRFAEQEVMIDEIGITTRFYGQTTHIRWNEVQSFAMWGSPKRFSVLNFEVTSEQGVARWTQLGPRHTFLSKITALKPDIPFDQYYPTMAKIQQVIVARSGKPLYDLRDEKFTLF